MAFNKARAIQEAEKLASQGKTSLAIKQYLQIIERDPTDVTLLNTIGDLYAREKDIPSALRQFYRLANHFTREGFTVKAIAIYKKISKIDTSSVEPLLKLGELYIIQGLTREAREQYAQAVEVYRRNNQDDKALEVLRKVVRIDPENLTYRARLAEFCERVGRKEDAVQAYLESVQVALRGGEASAAELALKKAAALDPKNTQVLLLKARLALATQRPEEVEKIIDSPELKQLPAARELLLEAYLGTDKLEVAEKLVMDVYRANSADFAPLAFFVTLCVDKGKLDNALKPLTELADSLIEGKNAGPLLDVLRQVWGKNPKHIPTLELVCRVCERTADEFTLPEALEALGHAYVQSGNLEKAEVIYEKMVKREPENEHYKGLLRQALKMQGKEIAAPSPEALSSAEMALTPQAEAELEAVPGAHSVDAVEAALVSESLENSDLFSRYGLVDKAVAELEKVLEVYPEQVDIHRRIVELCQRTKRPRAGEAAQALARIFSQRGDQASARRYEQMARSHGAPAAEVDQSAGPAATEFDLLQEPPLGAEPAARVSQEPASPPPQQAALEPVAQTLPGSESARASEGHEIDLSGDFASLGVPMNSAAAEQEVAAFDYEEAQVEIDFYLEQGFGKEAKKAVEALEGKYPGNAQVAELRRRLDERLAAGRKRAKAPKATPVTEGPKPAPSRVTAPEWELTASAPQPGTAGRESEVAAPSPSRLPEGVPAAGSPIGSEPPAAGADALSSLAGDLASSLEGIEEAALPTSSAAAGPKSPTQVGEPATPLSSLLEELGEPAEAQEKQNDLETHYNLGVAFREMGLLDEAIGEFQKVVKGAQKGKFPPHFLQACTLLASSFMEKEMPAIAAKWYSRVLEMPDLDEESRLALYYDLGVAYEQAGDPRTALQNFTEVYSQNIDYRNVAEKIRLLKQKVS